MEQENGINTQSQWRLTGKNITQRATGGQIGTGNLLNI
jgi:hypothetical protein